MFPVWFACNTCRGSFQKLQDFLTHKKEHHLEEFQNTKCIIFEERRIIECIEETVSFLPTPQDIEEANPNEFIVPPTDKVKNETYCCNNPQLPCHAIPSVELLKTDHQSSDQDFELEKGSDVYDCNPVKTQHNQPVVLVKRLTSQQIQNLAVSSENTSIVKSSVKSVLHSTPLKANKCSEKNVSSFSPCKINATEATNAESKKSKQLLCENSPMVFVHDSPDLQSHADTPTNNEENGRPKRARPFECQYCGASFFQKYAIAQHLTWHATEETFKCVITQKCRRIPKTKNNFRFLTRMPSSSTASNKQRSK